MQIVDECGLFIGVFLDGEHVDIVQYVAYHFRFGTVIFQQQILFLDFLRLFKLHFRRKLLHLLIQHPLYLLGISLEYFLYFGDVFEVFFLILLAYAGACTVLDMVFQAYIELPCPDVFGREIQVAGA